VKRSPPFQLGTGALNAGTALPALYNGDLATGTLSNGSITAGLLRPPERHDQRFGGRHERRRQELRRLRHALRQHTYTGNTVVNSGQLTLSGTNSNPVTAIIGLTPQISGAINKPRDHEQRRPRRRRRVRHLDARCERRQRHFAAQRRHDDPRPTRAEHHPLGDRAWGGGGTNGDDPIVLSGTGGVGVAGAGTTRASTRSIPIPGIPRCFSGTLLVGNQNQIG
jgi:hypothetical protein